MHEAPEETIVSVLDQHRIWLMAHTPQVYSWLMIASMFLRRLSGCLSYGGSQIESMQVVKIPRHSTTTFSTAYVCMYLNSIDEIAARMIRRGSPEPRYREA